MSVDALDMEPTAPGDTMPAPDAGPWDRLRAYLATPEPASAPEPERAPADEGIPEPDAPPKGDDPLLAPKAIRRMLDSDLVQRVSALRTPGGLFPLVVFILFMLFAIVPVNSNGETRILLLWRALTGGAFLPLSVAHQRRLAEDQRIADDNAQFAQVAQAAGKVATVASEVVNAPGVAISGAQAGWDVFWATAGQAFTVVENHL